MKIATVKLSWKKSVSSDIAKAVVVVKHDGVETRTELDAQTESYNVEIKANTNVDFKIVTFDHDGLFSSSEVYNFTIGDLEVPEPATDLKHEIIDVSDVPPTSVKSKK